MMNNDDTCKGECVGRFGHHSDPAIDFCVEVEALLGEIENRRIGFENGTPSRDELQARIDRAMAFRVGADERAVSAKLILRRCVADKWLASDSDSSEWIGRAAACALGMIRDFMEDVAPERGDGTSINHLRWMAEQLVMLQIDSPTKACRWLGYLQGSLVALGLTTLDREKRRNLTSRQSLPSRELGATRCWCRTCRPLTIGDMRFVVCPECGNKRCPKAENHVYACTGSNALNQVPSIEAPITRGDNQ